MSFEFATAGRIIFVSGAAGTGAEVTRNAVISLPQRKVKAGMRSAMMLPDVALVDPALPAWPQGKTGAAASDALAETGQGFANYLMALGVIESVALFVMIFVLIGS